MHIYYTIYWIVPGLTHRKSKINENNKTKINLKTDRIYLNEDFRMCPCMLGRTGTCTIMVYDLTFTVRSSPLEACTTV